MQLLNTVKWNYKKLLNHIQFVTKYLETKLLVVSLIYIKQDSAVFLKMIEHEKQNRIWKCFSTESKFFQISYFDLEFLIESKQPVSCNYPG